MTKGKRALRNSHSLFLSSSLPSFPVLFLLPLGAPLGKDETAATRENLGWKYGAFEVRKKKESCFFLPFFFPGVETSSFFPKKNKKKLTFFSFLSLFPSRTLSPLSSRNFLRSPRPPTTSSARPPLAARPPRPSGRRPSPATCRSTPPRAPSSSRCCRASSPPAGRRRCRRSRPKTRAWRRACTRRRCSTRSRRRFPVSFCFVVVGLFCRCCLWSPAEKI